MSLINFPTILATTSQKKRDEWNAIAKELAGDGAPEFTLLDEKVGFVELATLSVIEVIITKALDAYLKLGYPVLVEDSSFEIEALGGFPGPLYAHTEKTVTNAGLCGLIKYNPNRRVSAKVVIGFYDPAEHTIFTAIGELAGSIPKDPQGPDSFGYDNIIIPEGHLRTLAELGSEVKNRISMRCTAIDMLLGGYWTRHKVTESPLWRPGLL
ncbi:MAG: ntpA [Candidatus Peribacteria bacterium]|nr:ntpA [Candidatus Peribacteria bacterium]